MLTSETSHAVTHWLFSKNVAHKHLTALTTIETLLQVLLLLNQWFVLTMLGATGPSCLVTMLAVFDSVTTQGGYFEVQAQHNPLRNSGRSYIIHVKLLNYLRILQFVYIRPNHQLLWTSSYQVSLFLSFGCQAIETLKGFEKKDSKVQSTAATNLSFLYFLVRFFLCIFCLRFLLQLGRIMSR